MGAAVRSLWRETDRDREGRGWRKNYRGQIGLAQELPQWAFLFPVSDHEALCLFLLFSFVQPGDPTRGHRNCDAAPRSSVVSVNTPGPPLSTSHRPKADAPAFDLPLDLAQCFPGWRQIYATVSEPRALLAALLRMYQLMPLKISSEIMEIKKKKSFQNGKKNETATFLMHCRVCRRLDLGER